eukprot:tig00001154_g7281.t1
MMGKATGKRKVAKSGPLKRERRANGDFVWAATAGPDIGQGPEPANVDLSDVQGAGPAGAPAAPEGSVTSQYTSEPRLFRTISECRMHQSASFLTEPERGTRAPAAATARRARATPEATR